MKRIAQLFLSVLIFTSINLAQQTPWQWVNPLPQGNIVNGMWAISQDTVVSVAASGTVVRTTNGGTTWQVEQTVAGVTDQLFATQFATSLVGWAVGESGLAIKTIDAGATWFPLEVPTVQDLSCLSFVSSTTGWVAGGAGVILMTTDGGASWTPQSSGTTKAIYSINFISTSTGWAAGTDGTILRTTNGGSSWTPQVSGTPQTLYSIEFISSSVGWVVGAFGTVLRTVNGGTTWTVQTSGTNLSLYSVQFSSFLNGWAVGAYGTILKSTNGGVAWFEESSNTYNDLFGIQFVSPTLGWSMGDLGTIIKTTDGGSTWLLQSNGVLNTLDGIYFSSPAVGFSVGEVGTIIKTTDAGITWTQQASGTFQTLYGAYFTSDFNGWAVGDSASILKTTNGGLNWFEQHSHTDPSLYSINFASSTNGWTVGDFGTILGTINGGTTWLPETSHTTTTLLYVKFANTTTGWVVGYGGTILKTTNGGATWSTQVSGTTRTLYAIETVSPTNVYICGDFGEILHTTNGGTTWTTLTTNTFESLYGLAFSSSTTGWCAGDDGTILHTSDGGTSWDVQQSQTINTLWAIQLVHSGSGGVLFSSGYGGTIICSGVSPLPIRTWVGTFDSSWTTAGNWNPIGIPQKIDSIYIPAASNNPVIRFVSQQINIASLRIGAGGRLNIGNGLSQLIVKDNVSIDGTLALDPTATTEVISGGDFLVNGAGTFVPGNSTVVLDGIGQMKGGFNNILLSETAVMRSAGNIRVKNNFTALSDFALQSVDTITIQNADAAALEGPGIIPAGTIKRAIKAGALIPYRFESAATYFDFYSNGVLPDTLTVTSHPNTLPPGLPDSLFARRYYNITASGGSNYMAFMSLHYDTSETLIGVDNLSLFRDSSGVIANMGKTDFLDSDIVAISLDSVKKFSTWYIGRSDYFPKHPFQFTDSIFVSATGTATDTLIFGAQAGATDSLDVAYGEAPLGSKPPVGTFDVRWLIPASQGSLTNYHDLISVGHQQNVYTCSLQPGPGGYPFTIRWNSSVLPPGTFFLRDQSTHGGQFNINMKLQTSYSVVSPSISQIEIIHISPIYYDFSNSWNLVSLPLNTTTDGRRIHIFPSATSNAFGYTNGYYIADTLKNGRGYWVKFPSLQHIPIDGLPRTNDTINLVDGWNMIGSISNAVAIGNIQKIPSTVVGQIYYGYSGSYTLADSIHPSKGYWVKASGSGKLIFTSSTAAPKQSASSPSSSEILSGLNSVTISDRTGNRQTLYFGSIDDRTFLPDQYELPPLPPDGGFDARFQSGRIVEKMTDGAQSYPIGLQSAAYPLTVTWQVRQPGVKSFTFRDPANGLVLSPPSLIANGSFVLHDPLVTSIELRIDAATELPKEFSLKQNYPNPFNPTTTIAFDLPVASNVKVSVFNILGQEVAVLANDRLYQAGSHLLTLNGENLGSGVYFYRMTAQPTHQSVFTQVKKMLLIK